MSCIRDNTPKDTEEARYIKSRGIHKTLKPCPFCKDLPLRNTSGWVFCDNHKCPIHDVRMTAEQWNTRAYPKRLTKEDIDLCLAWRWPEREGKTSKWEQTSWAIIDTDRTTENINNLIFGGD